MEAILAILSQRFPHLKEKTSKSKQNRTKSYGEVSGEGHQNMRAMRVNQNSKVMGQTVKQ